MRNLEIVRRRLTPLNLECRANNSSCYCAGESGTLYVVNGQEETVLKLSANVPPGTRKGQHNGVEDVFQIQYVPTTGYLLLAKKSGALWLTRDAICGDYEEFLKSEQGIKAFAASSDCRRLAILTNQHSLVLLSMPDLECLVVHELYQKDDTGPTISDYSGSIVWRNDCRYFAINVPSSDGLQREIRVYDEDGLLYSTSQLDEFQILNELLCWQPSGGLIATYGKSPHGQAIIFSELNGLKRSHLQLRETEDVVDIIWNSVSDILAIRYRSNVQLWIRSNYVWMLKKTLCFGHDSNKRDVKYCTWDVELPYSISIMYDEYYAVYYLTHKFTTAITNGSCIVVSWNGNSIYCTPLRDYTAPSPYGFYQAKITSVISEILVSSFWDGFLCISNCGEIILFQRNENSVVPVDKCVLPNSLSVNEVGGWAWPNSHTLCCSCNGYLITISLDNLSYCSTNCYEEIPFKELSLESTLIVQPEIRDNWCRLHPLSSNTEESEEILLETTDQLFQFNTTTKLSSTVLRIPQVFSSLSYISHQNNSIIVFLFDSYSNKLFMGSSKNPSGDLVKLSLDCTSCATFCDNLLLTTTSGSLEIYNKKVLAELLEQGCNIDENQLADRKFFRKVEKGSIIVACCVNRMLEPSLTLEIIPRGNFETICPRPLLVSTIRITLRDEVNQLRFEKIMTALRRHRLDYKVLIDEMRAMEQENSTVSLQSLLTTMVEQVQDSHSLVLLVTDLDDEYVDCIQVIKDILEEYLSRDKERKPNIEEAYLASMAKLGLLEDALLSHLIQGESKDQRNLVTHRVKFLSYYCDNPDILFDTSLGTYDLGLASLVADCLGKDPKEYVPILDELNALSELQRKFKIDDKLRRYSKAIAHLLGDDSTQSADFLKYMERHRLFTDVIMYIEDMQKAESSSPSRTSEDLIALLQESKFSYGRYLEEHTKFREAVILYRGANQFQRAIDCAIKCGEWEIAIEIFHAHVYDEANLRPLCEKIFDVLEDRKNYAGAARLCEIYLRDYAKAVGYWIKDRKWLKAKSLSQLLPELKSKCVKETVKPKLIEAATERKEYLLTLTEEVCQRFNRWRAVKSAKAKRALDGGGDDCNFSDLDSVSSYSSQSGSSGTGKTSRSGRNRRKQERRLYSLKEGSPQEDLAISAHLWNIFDKIQQELKPDTTDLISSLWEFNENLVAKELGMHFDTLLQESGQIVQEIWSAVLPDEVLEMKYRIPPPDWSPTWTKLCLHDSSSKAVKQ